MNQKFLSTQNKPVFNLTAHECFAMKMLKVILLIITNDFFVEQI